MRTRVAETLKAKVPGLRRRVLAYRYVRGQGLEIGALTAPLRVRRGVTVRYVDRLNHDGLLAHYPDTPPELLVPVHVVDDGEKLSSQADGSADFVIANHFIEHTESPLSALANICRVLRPGGVLYMAVPDRHRTFDKDRPPTSLDHVVRDYQEGPAWSRRQHQEEWARLVERAPDDNVATRADELEAISYAIHYHVWNRDEFRVLVDHARSQLGLPMRVVATLRNGFEFLVVLRKTNAAAPVKSPG